MHDNRAGPRPLVVRVAGFIAPEQVVAGSAQCREYDDEREQRRDPPDPQAPAPPAGCPPAASAVAEPRQELAVWLLPVLPVLVVTDRLLPAGAGTDRFLLGRVVTRGLLPASLPCGLVPAGLPCGLVPAGPVAGRVVPAGLPCGL